jgi:hypothetical protein
MMPSLATPGLQLSPKMANFSPFAAGMKLSRFMGNWGQKTFAP